MSDLIERQAAIDAIPHKTKGLGGESWMMTYRRSGHNDCVDACLDAIRHLPSAQPEPLTDKEQRIFLAAMAREEKVCEEVDRNHVHEPYEDSLMSVCKAIRRKVKDTLWT